jgi:SprT-like family protein
VLPILDQLYEEGDYRPTIKDVRKWAGVLNEVVFDGQVPKFRYVHIKTKRGQYGACQPMIEPNTSERSCQLEMDEKFYSFRFFLSILAHEMIHCYQWIVTGEKPHHGKSFKAWKDKLESNKIPLRIFYHKNSIATD